MIIYYHCTRDSALLLYIIITNLPSLHPLSFHEMNFCFLDLSFIVSRSIGDNIKFLEERFDYLREILETNMHRVDVGIMSQMVLWVHPIITGYQKTSVFQRKGVNQAYVVLRVVMVR